MPAHAIGRHRITDAGQAEWAVGDVPHAIELALGIPDHVGIGHAVIVVTAGRPLAEHVIARVLYDAIRRPRREADPPRPAGNRARRVPDPACAIGVDDYRRAVHLRGIPTAGWAELDRRAVE